jgi:hypothetical protein
LLTSSHYVHLTTPLQLFPLLLRELSASTLVILQFLHF